MDKKVSKVASDPVLVVDVQTTGSSPGSGHLLEVAWALLRPEAGDAPWLEPEVFSFLVALPEGEEIPPRISRITGLTTDMLQGAIPAAEVAMILESWVRDAIPVAHFAVFEQRWLDDLFRSAHVPADGFPGIICTRELARRLYPGLPRKGLRAVAGYLGHTVGEHRRAADHVRATAGIWRRMVSDLDDMGIDSHGALIEMLSSPIPVHQGSWEYLLPRERRLGLPVCPGTYRFLSVEGRILYVGKAMSLRHRVNSYFTRRKADGKTLELVSQVADLEVSECETPLEAALEEFLCIREHAPQYNVALRERGLQLVHLDQGLAETISTPDAEHPCGPVPSGSPAVLLGGLLETVRSGKLPEPSLLGLGYLPLADGALSEGISLFMEKWVSPGTTMDGLLLSGREIWSIRTEAADADEESAGEVGSEGDTVEELREPPTEITAEGVLKGLEWFIAVGARDLRTAAWFRLLGWARICWQSRSGSKWRLLDIAGGGLSGREWSNEPSEVPPSGPRRLESQAGLTPLLYDLLRVLQSEMRRIHSAGLSLRVILPTGRILGTEGLGRLFTMV